MTTSARPFLLLALAVGAAPAFAGSAATPLGPTPYLSAADSPFPLGTGTFCLEDFEGAGFDVPGVTGNGSLTPASGITDSVDGDDGTIDGSGTAGQSYFSGDGPGGITFTFDPQAPLGLPTSAGAVWTDGGTGGVDVTFESFDQNGASLGTIVAPAVSDGSNSGETAEDRFFGIMNPGGISAIKLSSPGGGIEVDHLQFDHCSAATPTTTTTLPPTTCAGVPSGPSFASLNCRIAALEDAVDAATQLGDAQSKLAKALDVAKAKKEDGEAKCAGGNAKKAGKRLQQTAQKLTQFSHRLRSNASRKKIPAEVREPLAAEADRIRDDAKTLRHMLACGGG
jgi:hypothetical protein